MAKTKPNGRTTVAEDPAMSLADWLAFINKLIEEHGEDKFLATDAGFNSVEMQVMGKADLHYWRTNNI